MLVSYSPEISTEADASPQLLDTQRCPLLELPLELQLSIYDLAVIETEPLLINVPCDSGRSGLLREEEDAWKSGLKKPPAQPALSRTCRDVRREVLPIFYGSSIFRGCYCKL
jgi:hypothetical protein